MSLRGTAAEKRFKQLNRARESKIEVSGYQISHDLKDENQGEEKKSQNEVGQTF